MTIQEEGSLLASIAIIEDYLPRDEEKFAKALAFIEQNLLKSRSIDLLNKDEIEEFYKVSALAINYIQNVGENIRESIYRVKDQLHDQLCDQKYQEYLAGKDDLKKIQNRLFEIFYTTLHSETPAFVQTAEEYIEQERRSLESLVTTHSTRSHSLPHFSKDLEGKTKQIKSVTDFAKRFMRDYYPVIVQGKQASPANRFLQHTLDRFMKNFPGVVPYFLFHAPKIVEQHEKDFIVSVLGQVTNFFHTYNLAIGKIKALDKQFDSKSLLDKETIILTQMHSIVAGKKWNKTKRFDEKAGRAQKILTEDQFIPEGLHEDDFAINLAKKLEEILMQYYTLSDPNFENTPKEIQEFVSSTIPDMIVPIVFQRILNPRLFRILFKNLLLRDIAIPQNYVEAPNFKKCDASDSVFTKQIGEIAKKLTDEILKFGEAEGIIKGVKVLAGKNTLGEAIQKGINHIMGTDTCFIPISLLDHLLYHNGRPTLIEAFNETSQEADDALEETVKTRIYEMIIKELPSFFAWVTNTLTSTDHFCETISKKIYELTQSKKLFMLFCCYLLEGVKNGFVPR